MNSWYLGTTRETWVCWSITSETRMWYGSRVRRQGRSRPLAANQERRPRRTAAVLAGSRSGAVADGSAGVPVALVGRSGIEQVYAVRGDAREGEPVRSGANGWG